MGTTCCYPPEEASRGSGQEEASGSSGETTTTGQGKTSGSHHVLFLRCSEQAGANSESQPHMIPPFSHTAVGT